MVRIVKDPQERRLEILETAWDLFRTKGYKHTTMKDVMEKLDIAKGTIYHYFKSKEAMFEAVVEHIVEQEVEKKSALIQGPEDALTKIKILTSSSAADEHPEILSELNTLDNAGMHTRQLVYVINRMVPLYAAVIEQGCAEGVFETDTPLETAEFMLAGVQFLTDMGVHPWALQDLIRRGNAFPAIIERLLNAPKGSFNFIKE